MNLANFKLAIIATEEGRKGLINPSVALSGLWKASYPLLPNRHGDCFFSYQDTTHPPLAALSVFDRDHLLATFSGGVYLLGTKKVRVMWPAGVYELTMNASGKVLSGTEYLVNTEPQKIVFKKVSTNSLN